MGSHRFIGLLLAAAAVLMVPSAAATDSERPGMERPGPWLDIMLSQAGTDAATLALHDRARRSYDRMLQLEIDG